MLSSSLGNTGKTTQAVAREVAGASDQTSLIRACAVGVLGRKRGFCVLLVPFLVAAALALGGPAPAAANKEGKLPEKYRQWLERDVAYIITREEKAQLLMLSTDADRDKFIEHFWEIRNPTLGSPQNLYREEIYKRIAFANDHFGQGKRVEGWRTDRGHTYITLGPPAEKQLHYNLDRVRQMEIWFYQNSSPALPPFFYIVFYREDTGDDFKLYSPYFDGPQKLITERGMTDLQALRMIERDAGREVARISLSLIPGEPVDLQNPRPSMDSDLMLSKLHDLANNPLNVDDLQRRAMLADVTTRLLVGGQALGVLTIPLRDADGNINLHYLLRLRKPEDFTLGKTADDHYYFSVNARVKVFGPDHKVIFTQDHSVKHYLTADQVEQVKDKLFGYEGWLPLPAGTYQLDFLLTDWLKKAGYQAEKTLTVPAVPTRGIVVTPLVPFRSVETIDPQHSGLVPFSVAGLKFAPLLERELNLAPADSLKFFYQIWEPPSAASGDRGDKLEARYAFGRPGAVGDAKVVRDEVLAEQFDPKGSLLSGKKIPLGDWPPGNYLLTMTLTGTANQKTAFGTMPFRLLSTASVPPAWDVFDGEGIAKEVRAGVPEYQRGLCYLAQGSKDAAAEWFRRALEKNPAQEEARSALVNLDFERQAYGEIARLAQQFPVTSNTDEAAILRMAESLDKVGETHKAIELVESAMSLKSPSGPLYITLASYYRRMGNARKADELEGKGRSLMAAKSPAPASHQ